MGEVCHRSGGEVTELLRRQVPVARWAGFATRVQGPPPGPDLPLVVARAAFAGAARQAAGETGAITVLVSHRFSTVRMADLVIVLDGGTVAEVGSHRELLDRRGLYAELYALQARAYR